MTKCFDNGNNTGKKGVKIVPLGVQQLVTGTVPLKGHSLLLKGA